MKVIFSDKVIATLRKIPTAVWFLLLAVVCFFKDCSQLITASSEIIAAFDKAIAEQGLQVTVNATALTVFSCIFQSLFVAALAELLMFVAYTVLARRFYCAINKKDFVFRLRIVIILSYFILGIFNISGFFWQAGYSLIVACTGYIIPALAIGFYYEDFRKRFVPKRNHAKCFGFAATIYVGIYFVLKLGTAVRYTVASGLNITALDMAAIWVDFGLVVVSAILAYLDYRRLDKIAKEPEDNDLFIPKENNDDKIFKDLGF
ncbi:MAG: hypothetical protein SO386_03005 [Eubacteriales bacterium]|nr:hypothetical protein [Eubacteriales bacterium]